jgi:hypothetical protein
MKYFGSGEFVRMQTFYSKRLAKSQAENEQISVFMPFLAYKNKIFLKLRQDRNNV